MSLLKRMVFVALLPLVCGPLVFAAGSRSAGTSAADSKKVLTIAAQDPQVALDMQLNTYSLIMRISDNTTESLLVTKADGSLEPVLLTRLPEMSADGLTFSFELKPGVTFHNGQPAGNRGGV